MAKFKSEISALVRLALPVSLAQLALVGMTATDVLVAGNAGTVDLAGMNLGANAWNMIVLFFMGIGFATQPLVAKFFGARDERAVRHQFQQSLWLCFLLGILATLAVQGGARLLLLLDFEAQMLRIAYEYMVAISWCALPLAMTPAVRGTLEGLNQTRSVLWVVLAAFLINIPLDFIFVKGLYGFPKMGGVGCAWATVIVVWVMFAAMLMVAQWHKSVTHLHLMKRLQMPDMTTIGSTFRLGLPIGFSIVIELSMFCGAGIMIAAFGTVSASAHAVAITVASMSFMLYMGLGQGVTIRASQFLGARQPDAAWYTVKAGTAFNLLVAAAMCLYFIFAADILVGLFSDDPEVLALAVTLLYFGAAFQLADCLQVAMMCGLRAYHDTASPPRYQLFAFWVLGLPIGVGLAFYGWWPGLEGAKGLWFGMLLSLTIVGLLLLRRLLNMVAASKTVAQPQSGIECNTGL
ncbi:MAG: MATE family efflux transporter [Gammaproteobacteria bacterium]|nr:MATE family efflux transporter [Gammaproteobacteria bacterium]